MKPIQTAGFPILLLFLLFPSCAAPKFTAAQRAALSTVAIAKTEVDPEAYEEPYGRDMAARNASSNVVGAGASGPLVGLAIGSAVAGNQNNAFYRGNSSYFPAVRKNTPTDLGARLSQRLAASLKADAFFNGRIRPVAPNTVTSSITSYRLIRTGEDADGQLFLTREIYADIYLRDATGKTLAARTYIGNGTEYLKVATYARDRAKSSRAYDSALKNAVDAFSGELALMTAR